MEKIASVKPRKKKALNTPSSQPGFAGEWLELKAYGLAMAADGARPLLLLRNEAHDLSLPIPINHWEAGMTLTHGGVVQHHRAFEVLMESLQIKLVKCHFVRVRPPHLMVHLFLTNHPHCQFLELRAEEAMSLCLHFGVPIFATAQFIAESKQFVASLHVQHSEMLNQPQLLQKNHPYLM